MPSSYSSNIILELMATGENNGTWGDKTNTNLQFIEDAIADMQTINTTGGDTTLSTTTGAVNEARAAILKITGTLASNANIIVPAQTKHWVVWNATSGSFTVTVKTSGGTGVTVTQGSKNWVFCDGTNVEYCLTDFASSSLVFPLATTPSQTTNGAAVWDSDNFLLTVGNGSGRKTMLDTDTAQTATNKTFTSPTLTTPTLTLRAVTTQTAEGDLGWDSSNDRITVGDGAATKSFYSKTENDTLYQSLDTTLTALAGLATGANKIPYSTGTDTFGQLDFSTSTSLGASDTTIPSQNAIKSYIDTQVATKQTSDSDLTALANLATTGLIKRTGSGTATTVSDGTANQVLGMNNGATAQEYKTITAGSNVNVAHGVGTITISATGSLTAAYQNVREEGGTALTQRDTLNFVGAGITATDNVGSSWTDITLDATLNALAGLATGANKIPYSTGTDAFDQLDFSTNTSLGVSDTTVSSQNAVKSYVDTQVATKQASDATLTALAGVTTAADTLIYATASDTFTTTSLTATARTLLDDTSTTAMRTTLGAAADASTQTIYVPASAMTPTTTNGAAVGTVETTTNKVMLKTLDFDASTAEYAQFSLRMPKGWNASTVTAVFSWSVASGTGNVVWGCQGLARSNDDVLDTAFGTAQTVTDGVTAATDLMVSAATSAITIGGTPAAEDWVAFQVYRDAASGSDTFASDARLHGVTIYYTTTSLNDA